MGTNRPRRTTTTYQDGRPVQVWCTFVEWARRGETVDELIERLYEQYWMQYELSLFQIEPVCRRNGEPRFALVRCLMESLNEDEQEA